MKQLKYFASAVTGIALSVLVIGVPATVSALQDSEQAAPPSTNPAERVVYGSEGQDAEQQASDQLACYNWAGEQTSWDPYVAYKALEADHGEALAQQQATQGSAVKRGG